MIKKLLSIVIPTADRAQLLFETIKNIQNEVAHSGRDISILVLDNASKPSVDREVCLSLNVSLRRFEERGDVGDSIIRAMDHADSEFVWVFGDDDFMCPGVINNVYCYLEQGGIDIVYMNRYICPSSLSRIEGTEHPPEIVDFITMSGTEMIKRFTHHPGFISSIVFRKTLIRRPEECERLFPGYGFMAEIYRNARDSQVVYLTKPQVIQRRSVALWKASWPKFWLITLPSMFEWLETTYGVEGALRAMLRETSRIEIRTLLSAKANGYEKHDSFWGVSSKYLTWQGRLAGYVIHNWMSRYTAKSLYTLGFRIKNIKGGD